MGSRCCVIGSKFANTHLIRSLMSLVVAAKSTGCRGGRQCLFLKDLRLRASLVMFTGDGQVHCPFETGQQKEVGGPVVPARAQAV
jgi:hypothetical protein